MSKKLRMLLSVLLMLTMVMACGNSLAAKKPDELVIGFWTQTGIPKDYQKVIDKVNEILIRDCNCKIVDTVALNIGSYRDQLTLILSGGEHLDAFFANGNNFSTYVTRGQVIELDELLAEYGQDVVRVVGEEFLEAGKVGGVQYGITTIRDLAALRGPIFLADVLDQAGVDYSNFSWRNSITYDELHDILVKIRDNTDMVPLVPTGANYKAYDMMGDHDMLGDSYGVLMHKGQESTTVVNMFATQEYMDFCKMMRQWYTEGLIMQDAVTNQESWGDLLRGGRGASFFSNLKPGYDLKCSAQVGKRIISVPVITAFTTTNIVQTGQWCIARNSECPEAAMKFINKLFCDEELINLLAWGIEGEHYQIIDQEKRIIDYPEGVNVDNIGYNLNLGWVFGNQFADYIWNGDSPDLWVETDEFNHSAPKSLAFGFNYDALPVKTEVAAVTNVCNEYRVSLEYGAVDPEIVIPEFLEKLKAAGIDKIIAEKQRQLDAFLASK